MSLWLASLKGTVPRDFLLQFFHVSVSAKPRLWVSLWGCFYIFENSSRFFQLQVHTGVVDTVANGKILQFFPEIHFKVSTVWYCFKFLPPVLLTPVANLPTVSLIPDTGADLWISSRIFEKIRNDHTVIFRGFLGRWFMKKPKAKNLVTLSL